MTKSYQDKIVELGKEENYTSPYFHERLREYENMETVLIFKDCWITCIDLKDDKYTKKTEINIESLLKDDYSATNVEFDRDNKIIKFQIDCEEIEI